MYQNILIFITIIISLAYRFQFDELIEKKFEKYQNSKMKLLINIFLTKPKQNLIISCTNFTYNKKLVQFLITFCLGFVKKILISILL